MARSTLDAALSIIWIICVAFGTGARMVKPHWTWFDWAVSIFALVVLVVWSDPEKVKAWLTAR